MRISEKGENAAVELGVRLEIIAAKSAECNTHPSAPPTSKTDAHLSVIYSPRPAGAGKVSLARQQPLRVVGTAG